MTEAGEHAPSERRVALISGANRGIGLAIARALADSGWRLSLGMRDPQAPTFADPDQVDLFAYDASMRDDAEERWVAQARARFGRIDAIVANAGVLVSKSVIDVSEDELDRMFEVNVRAPRRLARSAWPSLCESGHGRAVIIASLSGKRVKSAGSGSYAMTKFAAVALAHALRQEGWEAGVRATAICPGYVATDMGRQASGQADTSMTSPADIAQAVEMILNLPNTASVAEFAVNCSLDDRF